MVLAHTAVTNAPASSIQGDLGLSPGMSPALTGFALVRTGTHWKSSEVAGDIFAADGGVPTPTFLAFAVADMEAAYLDAASRKNPDETNLLGGKIGGATIAPGLYRFGAGVGIVTDVTLAGGPQDTWIFQITGDLAITAAQSVVLTGGARASNVVWQVSAAVTLGAGAHLEGVVLSKADVTFGAGATSKGRLFSQNSITLAASTVAAP